MAAAAVDGKLELCSFNNRRFLLEENAQTIIGSRSPDTKDEIQRSIQLVGSDLEGHEDPTNRKTGAFKQLRSLKRCSSASVLSLKDVEDNIPDSANSRLKSRRQTSVSDDVNECDAPRGEISEKAHPSKFPCSSCGAEFSTKHRLQVHARTHTTGQEPHRCTVCGSSFSTRRSLQRHLRAHTDPPKPLKCSVCGMSLASAFTLDAHMRTHTGERPYACNLCDATFAQSCTLATHRDTHTGNRPYRCSECGACFGQRSTLVSHLRMHTGRKPFACPECGARFTRRSTLNVHVRAHTGEKPFKCSVCGAAFYRFGYLTDHVRRHTREKSSRALRGRGRRKRPST